MTGSQSQDCEIGLMDRQRKSKIAGRADPTSQYSCNRGLEAVILGRGRLEHGAVSVSPPANCVTSIDWHAVQLLGDACISF